MPEWLRQPADGMRKATEIAGAHRDSLLLLLKGVLAATAGWFIADTLLGAPSPTFAPFAALLTVQATISGSLKDGVRFMVCGVALATLVTALVGTSTASFAGLVLLASALGRWRRLAPQGTQVAVSALFAFAALLQSDSPTIDLYNVASMVGLALLGCCLGVVTNMVVVPPLRYRSAEYGISALSQFMTSLLTDVSEGLREGIPDQHQADGWVQRAEDYSRLVAQARAGIEGVAQKMRFNPRRIFQHSSGSYEGHRIIVNTLDRAGGEVLSITRAMASIRDTENRSKTEHDRFCIDYSQFLPVVGEAVGVMEGLRRPEDTDDIERLDTIVGRARTAYSTIAERARDYQLDDPDQWPVYGSMQIDGHRLIEELTHAQSSLKRLATTPRGYAD
ncbi:aromatic acid exporter family protein [Kocuria sp. TGY1127_2]|uniref:FUSC family protein n=1 Tax=Kocuria sp. TGY1127_2 TaxID=2711328 RepID=UPI0015C1274B|nr:aromatic acid exporter family protein [Kocuria sp. TGY1127_2]